ncbi:DUF2764 domain-containing protein [Bacteroidales bacterium OttesenSCG-928-J16]|nr:DUF2764 domain-containing protein [Bacteroidales bacterium OttesenSCG-928-J16]
MQYYALIAGLPDITLDDAKLPFSVLEFKKELNETLSSADKKLVDSLFLKYDNENLLAYLRNKDAALNEKGTISSESLADMVLEIKEVDKPQNKKIPPYFPEFVADYLSGEEGLHQLFWEDQLASLYYDYLLRSKNAFIREWAALNLNINNVLTALAARRNGQEYAPYIVGNNEVAQTLRSSNARDFGLTDIFEEFDDARRIDEETDLIEKERKVDRLRWEWLDEKNFFNYFSVERVVGFVFKLQMLERWLTLNAERGKEIFVEIVDGLRRGATETSEF